VSVGSEIRIIPVNPQRPSEPTVRKISVEENDYTVISFVEFPYLVAPDQKSENSSQSYLVAPD